MLGTKKDYLGKPFFKLYLSHEHGRENYLDQTSKSDLYRYTFYILTSL